MILLSSEERVAAAADVRELILASGQEAVLLRSIPGERLYGSDDAAFSEVGRYPVEVVLAPAKDLRQGIDGVASLLPDVDIRPEDRLRIDGIEYRVQTVKKELLFGVVTHRVAELVRIHGS